MLLNLTELQALRSLAPDGRLLVLTRMVHLFAFGFLAAFGLTDQQIGVWLTLMLVGDAVLSSGMATMADRLGRQRMLVAGAGLMIFGGLVFGLTSNLILLLIVTIV
jgi:MFS family permease